MEEHLYGKQYYKGRHSYKSWAFKSLIKFGKEGLTHKDSYEKSTIEQFGTYYIRL